MKILKILVFTFVVFNTQALSMSQIKLYKRPQTKTSKKTRYYHTWHYNSLHRHSIIYDNRDLINKMIIKDILNMKYWEEEKLFYVEENYEEILNGVIWRMYNNLLNQAKELKINTPGELLSFLFAHYIVNLEFAYKTARSISSLVLTNLDDSYSPRLLTNEILPSSLNQACQAMGEIHRDRSLHQIYDRIKSLNDILGMDYLLEHTANAGRIAIKNPLSKLEFYDKKLLRKKTLQLSVLFALAYVSEPYFQKHYLLEAYKETNKALGNKVYLSNNDIIDAFASHTWLKSEELAKNPFIRSLREIMTRISNQNL